MDLVPVKPETKTEPKHEHEAHDHSAHAQKRDMSEHDHTASGGHAHHAGMIDDFKRIYFEILFFRKNPGQKEMCFGFLIFG